MTPRRLQDLLHAAAAELGAGDPPQAPVRRAPADSGAHYTTALALRLSRPLRRPAPRLAAALAERLRAAEGVVGAWASPQGFVNVTVSPRCRLALAAEAAAGWHYALGLIPAAAQPHEAPWAWSDLAAATTPEEAAALARRDARSRLEALPAAADAPSPLGPSERRAVSWRDPGPAAEPAAPHPGGQTARLLREVGDAGVRISACGEFARPPTVQRPGVWRRAVEANPAFALRHAHAHAHTAAHVWGPALAAVGGRAGEPSVELHGDPAAQELLAVLFDAPAAVAGAHHTGRPTILVRHLEELAAAYRALLRTRRAAAYGAGPAATHADHTAGLDVRRAVAEVLAVGLFLLGVRAPTRL